MASVLNPPLTFHRNQVLVGFGGATATRGLYNKNFLLRTDVTQRHNLVMKAKSSAEADILAKDSISVEVNDKRDFGVVSMHHVGILCENLERSLDFYQNILGLEINEARPHDKLPYRGAWLWVGSEMIHLMELPNPDPLTGRPEHGGRDRHTCIAIQDVSKLKEILDEAGIPYTLSKSGRPAIFTRDPDANALEFTQV
ncbi:OLC1v1037781C1 [Oldenlandia corymbosa var. corymbosa]|uniref:OLC1v1037781C1 n=1 Tax=Oldenlandia corymbosa var. corymbosa TaxID=529605 RepID=A0AAV1CYB8_OLDCO|nr:OLC1v1037781C1 [Oldenlandia corymbosa var. corymbosa]